MNDVPAETNSRRLLIALAIVFVAAAAFWLILVSPKRGEADELATQVESQQLALTEARTRTAEGEAARKAFPDNYRKLVVLGKAVPQSDETASLIVQLVAIAHDSHVAFDNLTLESVGSESTTSLAQEAGPTSAPTPVPPTEAEAALLPLGSAVGQANLGVMPYKLNLTGTYTHLADYIQGIERLIKTRDKKLVVDGRLLTLDGFSLTPKNPKSKVLEAEIGFAAYLAPPTPVSAEGGATQIGSEGAGAVEGEAVPAPEAATTTASPSSYSTGEAR